MIACPIVRSGSVRRIPAGQRFLSGCPVSGPLFRGAGPDSRTGRARVRVEDIA